MSDIHALRERAKELSCLYQIDAVLADRGQTPAEVFRRILGALPAGWQRPKSTAACIRYLGRSYVGDGFSHTKSQLTRAISVGGTEVGEIQVSDSSQPEEARAFLAEEEELLRRISNRLGEYLEWKHAELLGGRSSGTEHWSWRQRYAESLADHIDPERFGVSRLFIGGSTALGKAGPGSDIDLYVLTTGTQAQRDALALWLEGWSLCLAEVSLQQTGQPFPRGMLNVQWLEDAPNLSRRPDLQELALGARPGAQSTT